MLTDIIYLKYIKRLCWSNKVEAWSAVFMTMRSVFLLLGGANLDVVIYRIWMPVLCPLFLMHVLQDVHQEHMETYLNLASKNTSETDIFPHGTKSLLTSVIN